MPPHQDNLTGVCFVIKYWLIQYYYHFRKLGRTGHQLHHGTRCLLQQSTRDAKTAHLVPWFDISPPHDLPCSPVFCLHIHILTGEHWSHFNTLATYPAWSYLLQLHCRRNIVKMPRNHTWNQHVTLEI